MGSIRFLTYAVINYEASIHLLSAMNMLSIIFPKNYKQKKYVDLILQLNWIVQFINRGNSTIPVSDRLNQS
jgi:hypothetical protein